MVKSNASGKSSDRKAGNASGKTPGRTSGKATAWHTLATETALDRLGVEAERGLEASAALQRLEERGPNELLDRGAKSALRIFAEQFTSLAMESSHA